MLESGAANGLYGALPPASMLKELRGAVDWESIGEAELDGVKCTRLKGNTKRPDFPLTHVALGWPAVCQLYLEPKSKKLSPARSATAADSTRSSSG